jgi:hypothetical protein
MATYNLYGLRKKYAAPVLSLDRFDDEGMDVIFSEQLEFSYFATKCHSCPLTQIHSMPWNCVNFTDNFIEFRLKKVCWSPLRCRNWNVGIIDRSNNANGRAKTTLL